MATNERPWVLGGWENTKTSLLSEPQSQLMSVTMAASGLTPAQILAHARGQERFFWQAARDQAAYAGFGVAADLRAWGSTRYRSIHTQAASLFNHAVIADAGQPLAAPRLFGGFSFRDDFTPDNTWAVFHPAQFILPHYQFVQQKAEGWLTINAVISPEDDRPTMLQALQEALQARYELLMKQPGASPKLSSTSSTPMQINYPMSFETWQAIIKRAIQTMQTGDLNKVVLSRVCEIRFADHVAVDAALHYLNETYPDCHRFLFEPRPYHAFYGATPEILVQVHGRNLTTMGLAGSARRGKTAAEDAALAQALRTSAKDLYEHAVVVDSIQRRLEPLVSELVFSPEPEVLQLGYIQHLHTPMHGRLRGNTGILPIVEILHPTPALGGTPRHLAVQFISEAEPVPRGWYAAPVGWIDHDLDGTFAVAIRSAIAQDRRLWLHAGAGIVASSDPQKEWAETALKFKPMFNALGLEIGE